MPPPTEVISLLSSDPPSPTGPDVIDLSSDSLEFTPAHVPPAPAAAAVSYDSDDSDDLPELDDLDFSRIRAKRQRLSAPEPAATTSAAAAPASKAKPRAVVKSAEEKRRQAEVREAEKERKRVEKERAKEERARQKEREKALAEVNKLRTDKKVSASEMVVDIPVSITASLKLQIETLLDGLDVQHSSWNSTVENVVKWRRKVKSTYNKETGLWEPVPLRVEDEAHVLVIIQASDLIGLILGEEGRDLEAHVLRMASRFPTAKVIYLVEGFTAWMRRNRNLLNRQFASAVRSLGGSAQLGSSTTRQSQQQQQQYVDEDRIEDALLSLQVMHNALIHHTNAPVETAQWVVAFTQHISTIPYRQVREASADAGFCMESGQVHTGEDPKEIFALMLQEITRVTAPIAYGISLQFRSVTELVRGFEREGPLVLAGCPCANKDGVLAERAIGQTVSKRLYKIFLGRDPDSMEV